MIRTLTRFLAIIWILILGDVLTLKAEPIDSTSAKNVARLFYRSLSASASRSEATPFIAYKAVKNQGEYSLDSEQTAFYVVNMGGEGYVIVAADNRVTPVLAYSTTSSFDGNQLPPNMLSLLREYQQQIEQLCEEVDTPAPEVTAEWEAIRHPSRNLSRNVVVEPLLTSRWDQLPYYNAMCPVEPNSPNGHASAGCTAVALGQVLRYWAYPVQGVGSHTYVSNNSYMGQDYGDYGTLTADFGSAVYDYDNMPDSLSASNSQTEINAVATLLYHCGVSLNTKYGIYNSSAAVAGIDDALRDYFGFEDPRHVYRSVFSESNWLSMIKNELNHWRPVIYTGAGGASVHAFVCDGYDDQNYFHMNWGWGGYADGYFLLSNLNPDEHHYNSVQTAVINVVVNPATLTLSAEELTFFEGEGVSAGIQRVDVQTDNVINNIHLSVTGSFDLSLDSVNFSSQLDMPASGGPFYVRYSSALDVSGSENSKVVLNAGSASDTVRLVGLNYMPDCHAPVSLSGMLTSEDTNEVLLTWQAPVSDKVLFSWDSVQRNVMGGEYAYEAIAMHRMEEVDLLPYHKHRLTHVSFIAMEDATEYRILVYKGGGLAGHGLRLYAGTKIVDKTLNISDLSMGEWNNIALDTPIVIDASQELWYGIYVAAPANTNTLVYGNSECVPYKGNVFGYIMPQALYWAPYSFNFVLKATIDNPFVQYELYRDGNMLTTTESDTSFVDYLPEHGSYMYEVKAVWNDQCGSGTLLEVEWAEPCQVVNSAENVHVCDTTYLWNGNSFSESGTYTHEYFDEQGCLHADTLYLTVGHTTFAVDTVVACDSYTWMDGVTYTASTCTPQWVLTNTMGCDSIVTLHLTVLYSSASVDTVTACGSYTWINGETYTTSTFGPAITFDNVAGCDSVVTLNLTILPASSTVDTVVTCLSSYTWIDGNTYMESIYGPSVSYQNAQGCDSVVTLNLIMLQASSLVDTVVACDSYTWRNGITYTESVYGPTVQYTDVIGCDNAMVTLFLTVFHSSYRVDTVVACDSYTWINGVTYTESTDEPTLAYTNADGCDSVVNLHLTLYHQSFQIDEQVSCGPFTWVDGQVYTENTDTPLMTYTGSNGCDSVVQLHLVVNTPTSGIDVQSACDAFTWLDGVIYTESTMTPTVTLTGSNGCDSVVTLHLTVRHSNSTVDSVFASGPYTWIDGVTYTESIEGPTAILENAEGCDSVVVLYLTVEVGVETHQLLSDFKLYPNPTSGLLNVQVTSKNELPEIMELQMFDVFGKLLKVETVHASSPQADARIDLTPYANGVYFIKLVSDGSTLSVCKVVKNR